MKKSRVGSVPRFQRKPPFWLAFCPIFVTIFLKRYLIEGVYHSGPQIACAAFRSVACIAPWRQYA